MAELIDTHAHLDHIPGLDEAMGEAAAAGLTDIIAVSEGLDSCRRNLEIKARFDRPRVHTAFGIHPGSIKPDEVDTVLEFIREHRDEAVAIGEIGLDFWYKWVRKDTDKKNEQRAVFRRQLELAKEFELPAIIHTRGTWRQALEIAVECGIKRALFHWYSGPVDVLNDILAAGFYVSCSPSLATSPQSREAITTAPVERTLMETDSPVFYRNQEDPDAGFEARPKDVARTLAAYADLKGMDPDAARERLNANARSFFGI